MTTSEFVTSLRKRGVELRPNGDRLHCSAPKGVLTPSIRTGLAERKEEILVFLKANVDTRSSSLSLQPISRDGELPLSFAQERLWFLEQLDAAAHKASNISVAVRLKGALNVTALHQAVNDTVIRHEVLRTTCSTVNGRPVQVIVPELRIDLPMIDLREIPSIQREAKALELANEEAGQSFDLARGPLLRVTLLQLGSGDHVLLLTTHLFVADGWSMGILFREIAAHYEASSRGDTSPLPELPIQYIDFTHWQRSWMRGEVVETQLAYWKEKLAGAPATLNLPTDHPRPAVQTYRGARQSFEFSVSMSESLRALSRREGVTLFITLLAALGTLLQRYTHEDDILVGTSPSIRSRIETEDLIGTFANNIVLRTDFSGNPTFLELLGRVRDVTFEAYAHQDLNATRIRRLSGDFC